ncbi:MAG: hypothetical protein FWD61_13205 [Phycisphaerales bacterium]|nr:hypothetical protein [Phycisphaerales bacterium]
MSRANGYYVERCGLYLVPDVVVADDFRAASLPGWQTTVFKADSLMRISQAVVWAFSYPKGLLFGDGRSAAACLNGMSQMSEYLVSTTGVFRNTAMRACASWVLRQMRAAKEVAETGQESSAGIEENAGEPVAPTAVPGVVAGHTPFPDDL